MNPKPMKRYYVTEMFTYTYEVEAKSEHEAREAYEDFKGTNEGRKQIMVETLDNMLSDAINVEEVK